MSKRKCNNKKSRWLCGILYPEDNESHKKALSLILTKYNSLAINHNKDVYLFDVTDENGEIVHRKGELKKAHYHFVVHFENARYISGFAKELGIEENVVQVCGSFKSTVIYCTHIDEPLKYQYQASDFVGWLVPQAIKILDKPQDPGDMLMDVLRFIQEHPSISWFQLAEWCNTYGYYSTLMRNMSLIREVYFERRNTYNNHQYLERSKNQ